jgi:putative transposase
METGLTYHIYNHANGTENIFREEENYRYFLQQYAKYLGDVVDTYAYCLMPNHFHLLIGVKELDHSTFPKSETLEKFVSKQFANFFSSYTQSFNKMYERRGSLFIKNFKRKSIETDKQWQDTFLYIHLNPIKHGFVKHLDEWKWSSWSAYRFRDKRSLVNREGHKVYFDHWEQVDYLIDLRKEILMNMDLTFPKF